MSQQFINVGTAPDDHTGDPVRTAFTKTNENFTELYNGASGGISQEDADLRYLQLAGGEISGSLYTGDLGVTGAIDLAGYASISEYLEVVGNVVLYTEPTADNHAATKQYVDNRTPQITVSSTAPGSPATGDIWIDIS